jgi:hypothetical protein
MQLITELESNKVPVDELSIKVLLNHSWSIEGALIYLRESIEKALSLSRNIHSRMSTYATQSVLHKWKRSLLDEQVRIMRGDGLGAKYNRMLEKNKESMPETDKKFVNEFTEKLKEYLSHEKRNIEMLHYSLELLSYTADKKRKESELKEEISNERKKLNLALGKKVRAAVHPPRTPGGSMMAGVVATLMTKKAKDSRGLSVARNASGGLDQLTFDRAVLEAEIESLKIKERKLKTVNEKALGLPSSAIESQ